MKTKYSRPVKNRFLDFKEAAPFHYTVFPPSSSEPPKRAFDTIRGLHATVSCSAIAQGDKLRMRFIFRFGFRRGFSALLSLYLVAHGAQFGVGFNDRIHAAKLLLDE
jgi:hypothetical protein